MLNLKSASEMFEYLTSQQKTNQILYMKLNFKSHSQFQLVITNSLTDSSVFSFTINHERV